MLERSRRSAKPFRWCPLDLVPLRGDPSSQCTTFRGCRPLAASTQARVGNYDAIREESTDGGKATLPASDEHVGARHSRQVEGSEFRQVSIASTLNAILVIAFLFSSSSPAMYCALEKLDVSCLKLNLNARCGTAVPGPTVPGTLLWPRVFPQKPCSRSPRAFAVTRCFPGRRRGRFRQPRRRLQ